MDSLEQVILDVSDYSQITNFPEGWRKKLAEAIKVWIKEKLKDIILPLNSGVRRWEFENL
jgi:hypothetical protein